MEYFVWWLTESDYCGFEPSQEANPLKIPDYAWEQFCNRHGRAGRARLWVAEHINLPSGRLPVSPNDSRFENYMTAGGIVIEAKDAQSCALWGGRITTLMLDPVTSFDTRPYIMNRAASALGKLGKGKKKTLTAAEIARRKKRLAHARAKRWPKP